MGSKNVLIRRDYDQNYWEQINFPKPISNKGRFNNYRPESTENIYKPLVLLGDYSKLAFWVKSNTNINTYP